MLKRFQKTLRTNQTDAASRLWYHLRGRRFQGWKFRRQHILQNYAHVALTLGLFELTLNFLDFKKKDFYRKKTTEKRLAKMFKI